MNELHPPVDVWKLLHLFVEGKNDAVQEVHIISLVQPFADRAEHHFRREFWVHTVDPGTDARKRDRSLFHASREIQTLAVAGRQ